MPRPKGSKNKTRKKAIMTMEEMIAAKASIEREMSTLSQEIHALSQALKGKRAELQAMKRKLKTLEEREAAVKVQEVQAQREADAQRLAAAFMDSDKSLEDVMKALI